MALALEYEAICLLAEHRLAAGASERDVQNLLDALLGQAIPVNVHYQWRPQLRDAADEMVLEAAVNGQAEAIVSFNHRDYGTAPGRFGLQLLTPVEMLYSLQMKASGLASEPRLKELTSGSMTEAAGVAQPAGGLQM